MNSQTKVFPFSTNSCSPKAERLTGEQMGGQLMALGSLACASRPAENHPRGWE